LISSLERDTSSITTENEHIKFTTKMKIVFLTGAGVSKESGLDTFRDVKDGLWNNYNIQEVATPQGWKDDREQVIEFYTMRKAENDKAEPNEAHKFIAELEKEHEVVVITQNIDDLHERGGSTNVIHVHGSINEAQSSLDPKLVYTLEELGIEEGYIKMGTRCERGSQVRPNVVWFGEAPYRMQECYNHTFTADIFVTVGTSFNVNTAANITAFLQKHTKKVLVDPGDFGEVVQKTFDKHIKENATTGIKKIFD
jgi:NAD-dependent deacetylase